MDEPKTKTTYDVILADPPWSFKVWNKDTGNGRSAEAHYPTMSLDDICALPIRDLASPNCVLFMWSVWPSIFEAEKVITAWGFKYKTLGFEWWKLNKSWERALLPASGYKWLEKMFFFLAMKIFSHFLKSYFILISLI